MPRRLCVRWGPSSDPTKRHSSPTQFLAHVHCGQTARLIKMPLGTEVNLGPGDDVLDGVAAPPKRGHSPQFPGHVYCGKTAGSMRTPLCTEVDLGPGHVVLDGDPAPPRKGRSSPSPIFGKYQLRPRSPISATAEFISYDISTI